MEARVGPAASKEFAHEAGVRFQQQRRIVRAALLAGEEGAFKV
jgi:hypothetical protein